jgi:hypothetical protein
VPSLEMTAPAARPFASRLWNLVAFVAIVWGVATTFVAFDVVSMGSFDLVQSHPAIFGDIALSRTVTQSTSCEVRPGDSPEPRGPAVDAGEARSGAWLLGLSLGRDALLRQYAGAKVQALDELGAGRSSLADRLGVPAPAVFRAEQMANANIEFVAVVEQDPGGTAHSLAVTFSPQACELFKLGALWGYSEMVRPALPGERAVFAMEIRHYALRASLPEPLWSPMLQRVPADAKFDDVIAQMTALTNAVTTYLTDPAAGQPNAPQ